MKKVKENHPEYLFEQKVPSRDEILAEWEFTRAQRGGRYPYDESPVEVSIHRDGAVSFWSSVSDSSIYLYAEQVKKLLSILRRVKP